jgi:hypothetical protein
VTNKAKRKKVESKMATFYIDELRCAHIRGTKGRLALIVKGKGEIKENKRFT